MSSHSIMKILAIILPFLVLLINAHVVRERGVSSTQENNSLENAKMVDDDDENDRITEAEDNLEEHYFQGDILMTPEQTTLLHHAFDTPSYKHDGMFTRGLVKDLRRTWKDGIIYYTINKNVGLRKRKIVNRAMKHWKTKTCLQFEPRNDEKDYIEFKYSPTGRCASNVGRIGGKQNIFIGNNRRCRYGNIIHEIGHSIGFFHEQARPDRDDYVDIKWKNILKSRAYNFQKFSTSVIDSRNHDYDYGSVMHYGPHAFGKGHRRRVTIERKDRSNQQVHMGQRLHLSEYDILQARDLYNCDPDKYSFLK